MSALKHPLYYCKHETDLVICFSAYMRFKGYDCMYTDDPFGWALYEEFARTNNGFVSNYWGKWFFNYLNGFLRAITKRCDKISQWSFFEITFGIEADYFFGKERLWSQDLHFVAK